MIGVCVWKGGRGGSLRDDNRVCVGAGEGREEGRGLRAHSLVRERFLRCNQCSFGCVGGGEALSALAQKKGGLRALTRL
jgi:hypothetical protein